MTGSYAGASDHVEGSVTPESDMGERCRGRRAAVTDRPEPRLPAGLTSTASGRATWLWLTAAA